MSTLSDSQITTPLTAEEVGKLEMEWRDGKLTSHQAHILKFADQNRDAILRRTSGEMDEPSVVKATRQMIAELGTIQPAAELRDQIQEIQNTIWFGGQRGDYDHARIKREWTEHHAANWRRWRIQQYLLVVERLGSELAHRLSSSTS